MTEHSSPGQRSRNQSVLLPWEYPSGESEEKIFSKAMSGAQRLSNGNTLICVGVGGTLLEVTPKGETVWRYVNPVTRDLTLKFFRRRIRRKTGPRNEVFRAYKYAPDYPAFANRTLILGRELKAPPESGKSL